MSSITRRSFMARAGVAATALSAANVYGSNERIRVGVIGCRNRGRQVAARMQEAGQFEIAALCDCDEAMYARGLEKLDASGPSKPAFVKDFRKLLDDPDIDAVVVASPDHWHAVMTIMALDAGKHVYCEKPASFDISESVAMINAQKKHPDLVVGVGTQQRSGEHFKEAREFIQGGGLGKVAWVRTWIAQNRGRLPIVPDSEPPATLDYEMWVGPAPYQPYNEQKCHYNWHFQKNYGTGEMGNWGAHWIDVGRWFLDLDLPTAVMGLGGTYVVHDAKETPDTQTVLYQYPDLTLLWEQRIWTEFPLHREKGAVEFGGEKGSMIISRGGYTITLHDERPERRGGSDLEGAHVRNFADAVQGKAKVAASMEDGAKSATLCHLGNACVTLNRRLEFDPATQTFPNDKDAQALWTREYRAPWKDLV